MGGIKNMLSTNLVGLENIINILKKKLHSRAFGVSRQSVAKWESKEIAKQKDIKE